MVASAKFSFILQLVEHNLHFKKKNEALVEDILELNYECSVLYILKQKIIQQHTSC